MDSIWKKTTEWPDSEKGEGGLRPHVEAAVIGGGMAGILTAWMLASQGVDTVVLEANTVGSGQTGNTTAKVTAQHGLIYDRLCRSVGGELARQYAHANAEAIGAYEQLIAQLSIRCDWERKDAWVYSTQSESGLMAETDAAQQLGLPAVFSDTSCLPFPIRGAVGFKNQAQFHPLKFLYALAGRLDIYEHTPVLYVEGHNIDTLRGRICAEHIIFACHYPFINRPGYYFMRMHQERSYALALEGTGPLDGMYISEDFGGLSFRTYKDQLILGGSGHRTGENSSGGQYEVLRQQARIYWPDCRESTCWSAQDCMPMDKIPYIGQFSGKYSYWYVATGFKKWGMTSSMVAARLISDAILQIDNEDRHVFSPQRHTWKASAGSFIKDGMSSVRHLTRYYLKRPDKVVDQLLPGHGGIVRCNGEKVGAYKDMDGHVFCVSVKCLHLGCQLEWNPEEKTWDCPCHGSRYDHTGMLINNPAQEVSIGRDES